MSESLAEDSAAMHFLLLRHILTKFSPVSKPTKTACQCGKWLVNHTCRDKHNQKDITVIREKYGVFSRKNLLSDPHVDRSV
jgi:hypothetical protein